MAIMSDPAFPYAAIGMVHLENTITTHRAIGVGEVLDLTTAVAAPRAHARGVLLDFVTTVTSGGDSSGSRPRPTSAAASRTEGEPDAGLLIAGAPHRWSASGGCPPTWVAPTPASRVTTTRSTSTR